jgi:endothelin-converting enzyme
LLADSAAAGAAANPSFAERVTSIFQEPLTGLSKLLLALVLLFLLLSSVFIGLFAGAQHKLNTRKDKPAATATVTATATQTSVQTTTVSAPVPTGKPEEVRVS